ncbi:hypothetical protein Daesc_008881 [Daldinia eschscholtzii]|uniref:C2H2-type domain-containing protein n=1 Tax=Daldinia eschscholtzii TaxID=292717 RepID=A0AAX6MDL2_9PEZI
MGGNRKNTSKTAYTPETIRSSECITRTVSRANGISQYGNVEPAVIDKFHLEDHLEDTALYYRPVPQDSSWAEGGNGRAAREVGNIYGAGGKITGTEVINLSHEILPHFIPDTASTLTYSPPSSYQGSVLSSIQTDFVSDIFSTGTPRSRDPSPLQLKERISTDAESCHVCPREMCGAKFVGKRDLEIHSSIGHRHICLWGNRGPCSSAGFATTEELNWHVKREHLLLCPVPGCAEDTFVSRDLLDCHLKYAHGNTTAAHNAPSNPVNLLEMAIASPATSGAGSQTQISTKDLKATEDKTLRTKMSIDVSKMRCRERLRAILEKRAKKIMGKPRTL